MNQSKDQIAQQQQEARREEMEKRSISNVISEILAQRKNRLTAYGNTMPAVMHDIERETRWNERPIGPIGNLNE